MKKKLFLLCSLLLVLALLCSCGPDSSTSTPQVTDQGADVSESPVSSAPQPAPGDEDVAAETGSAPTYASSYAEIYELLSYQGYDTGMGGRSFAAAEEADAVPAEAPAPMEEPAAEGASAYNGRGDYSETNVQVAGIDEGDIVKTDGEYIYVLHDQDIIIFKADGPQTQEVSRLILGTGYRYDSDAREGYDYYYSYSERYLRELYVSGSRAAVIYSDNSGTDWQTVDGEYSYEYINKTGVLILDISDPADPKVVADLAQDGYGNNSRLSGDTLILVSNYYVSDPDEDDPITFVPCYYDGETATEMPVASIAILPGENYYGSYTVVSTYSLSDCSRISSNSLLGGGGTVYMTAENLYLAESNYYQDPGESYTESIYTVQDYTSGNRTKITRYAFADGVLSLASYGEIPGYLENQFSMDEYNGNLRCVSTVFQEHYKVYTDEERGFVNYEWGDSVNTNALYVLDSELNVIGSIEGLAEDEYIRSARFDGNIGYFVTFRQTDPLFAVDLSDPTAPTVLSALKIPGFSEYLHVWDEGLLFGLGQDANEETGWVTGLKLSMFDVSNPADVTEVTTLKLDEDYSVALYNHKAILISREKNLIGFPVANGYQFYSYDPEAGFIARANIDLSDMDFWYSDARGLYIGNWAYIVAQNAIKVLNLETFEMAASIPVISG